jgi:nicotinamidase/pyrazinamidase
MSGLIFWDVDTQYDFMHADGKLYVPGAEEIIPNLKRLSDHAHAAGIRVVASADNHVPEPEEISEDPDFNETFPPHCMRGTEGQKKIAETALRNPLVIEPEAQDLDELRARVRSHDGDILFHKHFFDVFTNANVDTVLTELDPSIIVLYGVALDVCDRYAIEGLLERRPSVELYLVVDAAKPIVREKGDELIAGWKERGVKMITTDEAVAMTPAKASRKEIQTA